MTKASDLALSGLNKTYGTSTAVEYVTMRIKEGELVAFLGPSGCGKTTTLRMIAGLTMPTQGQVLIGGRDVTQQSAHERNIGMLFQSYALFPHMTIAENVAFGLRMRNIPKATRMAEAHKMLEMVQLAHVAERFPKALSGGQQQRVALARALVIQPSLLLLDEPLGALDKNLREQMQVELRQIQKRLNMTTVLVTHDQEEALTMADKIVIMNKGRVEQMGTPTEIYARPINRFVAGFIGASNFLTGSAGPRSDGVTKVTLNGGGEVLFAGDLPSGQELTFTVRPEAVEIAATRPAASDTCWAEGVIDNLIYKGQATLVVLRRDNGDVLHALLPNRAGAETLDQLTIGSRVVAHWKTAGNHLLHDAA